MQAAKFFVLIALCATVVHGSPNVPIWELLTHQEKMGRLMYVFIHLVDNYCKGSSIPDCNKVLTLYGMSNLLNEDDTALNDMDPYHRNSRTIIWDQIMRGDFKLPAYKSFYSNSIDDKVHAEEDYDYINEVDDSPSSYQVNQRINKLGNDPHPYAVRVPAPAKIVAAHATRMTDSKPARSALDITNENRVDNENIAVGSSHPYAVKVLPGSTKQEHIPVGIKPSGDYEPMMIESQVQEVQALPPILKNLKRKRRSTEDNIPDEEIFSLLSEALRND